MSLRNKITILLSSLTILIIPVIYFFVTKNSNEIIEKNIPIDKITCGYWHSMKLNKNGTIESWGANWYGQLGNGSTKESVSPVKVKEISTSIAIAAGSNHSLSLDKDGSVWVWGSNSFKQLGIEKIEYSDLPLKVSPLTNIVSIACGDCHNLALKDDGTVWAWGYNYYGQLGCFSGDSSLPKKINSLSNVKAISCGPRTSLALKNDGTVWIWGITTNKFEQDCEANITYDPIKVEGLENIVQISSGGSHNLALKNDGTVWAWGTNGNGQFGDGTTISGDKPVKSKISDVKLISCGDSFCIALKNDGTVWTWGGGSPLGVGSRIATSTPKEIKILNDVTEIAASYSHSLVLAKNNTLFSWGTNWKGQIGIDSNKQEVLSPIICFSSFSNNKSVNNYFSSQENNGDRNTNKSDVSNNIESDELFSDQWALESTGQKFDVMECIKGLDINIKKAWDISKGKDTIIAIVDSGIDTNINDYKQNIYINKNEVPNNGIDDDENGFIDDVNGWDFANNNASVYDSEYNDLHGTMVSGVIASGMNNKGIIGTSPESNILPLKFINEQNGMFTDLMKALEYADINNIKLVNCSFGWYGTTNNLILDDFIKNSEALYICAAGNKTFDEPSREFFPACFKRDNIISVASINSYGILDPNSNYGSNIDIAAPGVAILTTSPKNLYRLFQGSSIATPFVSGVVALAKSVSPKLNNSEIKKMIINNVTRLNDLNGKVKSGGIVNAYETVKSAKQLSQ